jgi:hypothetical protein
MGHILRPAWSGSSSGRTAPGVHSSDESVPWRVDQSAAVYFGVILEILFP